MPTRLIFDDHSELTLEGEASFVATRLNTPPSGPLVQLEMLRPKSWQEGDEQRWAWVNVNHVRWLTDGTSPPKLPRPI